MKEGSGANASFFLAPLGLHVTQRGGPKRPWGRRGVPQAPTHMVPMDRLVKFFSQGNFNSVRYFSICLFSQKKDPNSTSCTTIVDLVWVDFAFIHFSFGAQLSAVVSFTVVCNSKD